MPSIRAITAPETSPQTLALTGDALPPVEDPFGSRKRLAFVLKILCAWAAEHKRELASVSVLDLGCGTGELLSIPLARAGFFVTAVDRHSSSIERAQLLARGLQIHNARFVCGPMELFLERHEDHSDVIVCSEVLEHVPDPGRVLRLCRNRLRPQGILVVTVPNGRGPFELEMSLLAWLRRAGVWTLLQRVKRTIGRLRDHPSRAGEGLADTLATDSPHVQFFRRRDLQRLLEGSGFAIREFSGRSFLCGPFTGYLLALLRSVGLGNLFLRLNNALGDLLPLALVSDWMLVAEIPSRLPPAVSHHGQLHNNEHG